MPNEKIEAKTFHLLTTNIIDTQACEEELVTAQSQWNKIHGGICTISGWDVLGETTGRLSVEAYLKWLKNTELLLTGDTCDPVSLMLSKATKKEPIQWSNEHVSELTELLRMPSVIYRVRWEKTDGTDFYTYAIGHSQGLRYDPLMACAILVEDREIPTTDRNTDIFHKDFGWIWQSRGGYTRGYVHAEVSVICRNGLAINSRFSTSHHFNLGSSDIQILPTPPALLGACASTVYRWAVASGTVTATVTVIAGALTATFTGTFGSTAGGSGNLIDCCKVQTTPTSTGTSSSSSTSSHVTVTTIDGTVVTVDSSAPQEQAAEQKHRGRLQVQGSDLDTDISWPWSRDEPPSKHEAQQELDNLRTKLTSRQFRRRNQAFDKVQRFIRQAPASGVDAVVIQSYYNDPRDPRFTDARVDIEVREGKAFKG